MNYLNNGIKSFLTTDHSPALRRAARVAGTVLAYVITVAWIAGECAFDLGRQLRLAVEARNDQLAALWVRLLGLTPAAAPAPAAEPEAPAEETPAPVLALSCGRAPIALIPAVAVSRQQPLASAPRATRSRKAPAAAAAPRQPRKGRQSRRAAVA